MLPSLSLLSEEIGRLGEVRRHAIGIIVIAVEEMIIYAAILRNRSSFTRSVVISLLDTIQQIRLTLRLLAFDGVEIGLVQDRVQIIDLPGIEEVEIIIRIVDWPAIVILSLEEALIWHRERCRMDADGSLD